METQVPINNKYVKKFILDASNDLEEIVDFLEVDYYASIEGIFNALFSLLRNYEHNESRVEYLLNVLNQLVEIKSTDELKLMLGPIIDFNNKISGLKLKQRIAINKPFQRVQDLLNCINSRDISEIHNEKLKYLSFLIFQDKNLKMIENFLNTHNNLLNSRNENGENIFEIVLNKYLFLEEKKREDISYFYQVIILFMNSKYGRLILKDSKQYFRMIKKTKIEYKEHIIRVMELFDPEFEISLDELEDRYHIKFDFPSIILSEVKTFKLCSNDRYDFKSQECITIDGKDSSCLDDAIYIEKNYDGTYTLFVHIVDIPSFVPFSSLTNEEARLRGETLYLRDGHIPLFPNEISNDMCSLLPSNIRNVLTYVYQFDSDFDLIDDSFQLVKGVINVKHRMSYEDVDFKFKNLTDSSLDQMLLYLNLFANVRRDSNKKKEKYRQLQNAVEFDTKHESMKVDYSPAANIVHESMILVNYSVASYFKKLSLPYIYRKLELPSDDFIEQQLNRLMKLESKIVDSKEFLYQLKESYAKPQYTNVPTYHKGLNLPCYSHSSSPARRYVDSYGQYMIYDMIFGGNITDFNLKTWEYRSAQLVKYLNEVKNSNDVFASHYNYLSYKKLIKERKRN